METFIKKQITPCRISVQTFLVLLLLTSFAVGQTKSANKFPVAEKNKSKFGKINRTISGSDKIQKIGYSDKVKTIEKSIAVNSKNVYVKLCVSQGSVKINGWNRNEVRAFIKDGENLGINVREKSSVDKKPVWVDIVGFDSEKRDGAKNQVEQPFNNCLSGETIELDVPFYADVKIDGRSSETSIDEVRSAKINIIDGDIFVNNVKKSTEAQTHQGSITIKNSGGNMSIETTTGNILAYNTESSETGDYFKAKTRSGAVTLQSIGQKEVDASSVSGTLNFVGEIINYGRYGFSTTNGLINLILPVNSSFRLTAAYGGAFQSELPLADISKSRIASIVSLTAKVGEGEANVTLKSYNGTIRIRKQNEKLARHFR